MLAETLASAGFPVLRFDFHGTGASSGDDHDPDRVQTWTGNITAAVEALRARSGVAEVTVVGLRLSATLAMFAGAEHGSIAGLVLWSPHVTGAACLRDLRILDTLSRTKHVDASRGAPGGEDAFAGAAGVVLTHETVARLERLDAMAIRRSPAPRALVIGGGGASPERGLAAHLESIGVATTYAAVPGHLSWMVRSPRGRPTSRAFNAVVSWFQEQPQPVLEAASGQGVPTKRPTEGLFRRAGGAAPVRETEVFVRGRGSSFGVLCQPRSGTRKARPTVVFLNRLGFTGRAHVVMARRWAEHGFSTFWFDDDEFTGFANVRAAMDALRALRCEDRFILIGHCARAACTLRTAVADPRVIEAILISPPDGDFIGGGDREAHDAVHFEERLRSGALFSRRTWKRLLRVEFDGRRTLGTMLAFMKRVARSALRLKPTAATSNGGAPAALEALLARGGRAFVIYVEGDTAVAYRHLHLGDLERTFGGSGALRVEVVPAEDHGFLQVDDENRLDGLLTGHLTARYP